MKTLKAIALASAVLAATSLLSAVALAGTEIGNGDTAVEPRIELAGTEIGNGGTPENPFEGGLKLV